MGLLDKIFGGKNNPKRGRQLHTALIGVNEYRTTGPNGERLPVDVHNLEHCVHDVERIRDMLNVVPANHLELETLTNQDATRGNIEKLIGDTIANTRKNDIAWIHVSSHGSREGSLVPHDGNRNNEDNNVSLADVRDIINNRRAEIEDSALFLLSLDSCFSGAFSILLYNQLDDKLPSIDNRTPANADHINPPTGHDDIQEMNAAFGGGVRRVIPTVTTMAPPPEDPFAEITGTGLVVLTASQLSQAAYEDSRLSSATDEIVGGVMTYFLLRALAGDFHPDGLENMSLMAIMSDVSHRVQNYVTQRFHDQQTPRIIADIGGNINISPAV